MAFATWTNKPSEHDSENCILFLKSASLSLCFALIGILPEQQLGEHWSKSFVNKTDTLE